MFQRHYEPLSAHIQAGKVLVIYGPRRVGKTTLLDKTLAETSLKYRLESGDNIRVQQILGSLDFETILGFVEGYELLAIDEAQNIPEIGKTLKIIVDQRPDIVVIATGSSSFELAGQVGEPLTGRKRTLTLFPLAQSELLSRHNAFELRERLEDWLVFGTYPEVVEAETRAAKIEVIREIADGYLLKDILAMDRVRNSKTLLDLLRLIAFQVGMEVSFSELAMHLGVDVKTIRRYLDLLEKAFVLIRLGGYSRNLRKEVVTSSKYYFYDTGLRNAVVAQFNNLDQRDDVGPLWENFVMIERLKHREYSRFVANPYFWRTYDQQELDLVEEYGGGLHGYEFKWSVRRHPPAPAAWRSAYPEATYRVITPENYLEFVAGKLAKG
jgi:predicted AAA+ superfamily ATPase